MLINAGSFSGENFGKIEKGRKKCSMNSSLPMLSTFAARTIKPMAWDQSGNKILPQAPVQWFLRTILDELVFENYFDQFLITDVSMYSHISIKGMYY